MRSTRKREKREDKQKNTDAQTNRQTDRQTVCVCVAREKSYLNGEPEGDSKKHDHESDDKPKPR
jgi:hypothetical protein